MHKKDIRPEHLDWVETALRTANPDIPHLRIFAQSPYGPSDRVAFIDVFGVDGDRTRRRQIRDDAGNLLRRLGYDVEIEPGRDNYDMVPIRPGPVSARDEIPMLRCLHAACDRER